MVRLAVAMLSNVHGGARIESIDAENMSSRLERGQVAVMAGFQGIAEDNRITTLGRGGSDTSAVALAALSMLIAVISTLMSTGFISRPPHHAKSNKA